MPIIGIGLDIIEIHRIEEAVEKYEEHFLHRVFTKNEIGQCSPRKDIGACLAARFAAKEAFLKALPSSIEKFKISLSSIEISREKNGKPFIILSGEAEQALKAARGKSIHLSLTHSRLFAAAVVIIES